MKIFTTIKDSIYNPGFYLEQKDAPGKSAFKYFLKLELLGALVSLIILGFLFIPSITRVFSPEGIQKITNYFPAELQIVVKNGQVSTNVPEPYHMPYSSDVMETSRRAPHPDNFLVIDTKTSFTMETFSRSNTVIFIGKDYIAVQKRNGRLTVEPLKTFPDMTIDRVKLAEWAEKFRSVVFSTPSILIVLLISFVAIFGASAFTHVIMILPLSLVAWIILKSQKIVFTYKQVYKLGLYVITSNTLFNLLASLLGLHVSWYMSAILFLGMFFANVKGTSTVVSPDQPSQ